MLLFKMPDHLCGNCGEYANPSPVIRCEKHEGGLPTQKPDAKRPPHPLEPTGFSRQSGRSSGVEHNLAKVGVEGSNPFARSNFSYIFSHLCTAASGAV
jgi:hypothetical protein